MLDECSEKFSVMVVSGTVPVLKHDHTATKWQKHSQGLVEYLGVEPSCSLFSHSTLFDIFIHTPSSMWDETKLNSISLKSTKSQFEGTFWQLSIDYFASEFRWKTSGCEVINYLSLHPISVCVCLCPSVAQRDGRLSTDESTLIPRPTETLHVLRKEECGSWK